MHMKPATVSKTARTGVILLGLSCLSLSGTGSLPAQAAPVKKAQTNEIKLSYDVYGAGFKLMEIDFDLTVTGNKYLARSNLKTIGFAKLFSALKIKYKTSGTFSKTRFRPARFTMDTKKKKKKRSATISWNRQGKPKIIATPPLHKKKHKAIIKALRAGMPDPLTALLYLTLRRTKTPCKLSKLVLDGRKIFQLKFSFSKQVNVTTKESKLYQGKAFHCTVNNRPIAGYSSKTMAKAAAKPKRPFNIWLVPVKEQHLGHRFMVPLFVTGSTNFADISVRLTKAKINGKSFKNLSLASN